MSQNIGSIWRKWDLHVHTQASDGCSSNEEIIRVAKEREIAVLGITDHHTVKNVDAMKQLGEQHGIKIIPGVEFRTEFGKRSVHLIALFPDTCGNGMPMDSKNLYDLILAPLNLAEGTICEKGLALGATSDHAFKEGMLKVQVDFKKACDLIHKYGGIVIPHNGTKSNGLDTEMSHDGKPGINEYNSLGPLKDELCSKGYIDAFDVPFNDVAERNFYIDTLHIPSISSSDAHHASDVGKFFSWIKADTNLEGLKQSILEPSRIFIGENKPTAPIHHISTVTTKFEENTYLKEFDLTSKSLFCFTGKREINLSPEFTCIIGGRGTGKSTLLSIIGKSLNKAPDSILEQIEYPKEKRFSDFVSLAGTGDYREADYISQSQVADFASNPELLTNTIYQRIKKSYPFDEIISLESNIQQTQNLIRKEIDATKQFALLEHDLRLKIQEKESKQNLIHSLTSKEYLSLTNNLKISSDKYKAFTHSKQTFLRLYDMLKDLLDFPLSPVEPQNEYDTLSASVLQQIKTIDIKYEQEVLNQIEDKLHQQKRLDEDILKKYLSDKNIKQESVNDIVSAQLQIKDLEEEISKIKHNQETIQLSSVDFFRNTLKEINAIYQDKLSNILSKVSEKLDVNNPNVKRITLTLGKNYVKMESFFWEDFRKQFEGKFMDIAEQLGSASFGYREGYIKNIFDGLNIEELCCSSQQDCLQKLKLTDNEKNITKRILFRLLNNKYRFKVFQLLIIKHFLDVSTNKQFNILYDNKNIEYTSFGQRCTATIITLLSLGNTPIIIDEPEAHLDSLLIADYLVKLIKEKKFERQIIFATHNPNFVVNGDADLILHLSIGSNGLTEIKPLTIEDLGNRDKILSLEGGKEAFKKREHKYSI